jgi:hypothetical protein
VLLTKLISFCAESTLEVSLWSKPQEYYAPFFYVLKKRQINQQNGLFTALFQSAIGLLLKRPDAVHQANFRCAFGTNQTNNTN